MSEYVPIELIDREIEVVRLLSVGSSTRRIARALDLSERSIKYDIEHAVHRNGLINRTHLVAEALRAGLIQ
jgi:DNA-binding CsgD family transcriptional regulator